MTDIVVSGSGNQGDRRNVDGGQTDADGCVNLISNMNGTRE